MALEGLLASAVEVAAWAIGKVTGRVFKIDPQRAENIGSLIVVGIIVIALFTVTLLYS